MNRDEMMKALGYIECALHILDAADAPADVGAHIDLAIYKLRSILGLVTGIETISVNELGQSSQ